MGECASCVLDGLHNIETTTKARKGYSQMGNLKLNLNAAQERLAVAKKELLVRR